MCFNSVESIGWKGQGFVANCKIGISDKKNYMNVRADARGRSKNHNLIQMYIVATATGV